MSMTLTKSSKLNTNLSEAQLKRIEENRQKALQKQQSSRTLQNENKSPTKATSLNSNHGRCVLLQDEPDRFEVIIGYNKELIDLFKTVNGRRYNGDTKTWSFSMRQHDELINKVKLQFNGNIKLDPIDKGNLAKTTKAKFVLCSNTNFEVLADYNPELQEIFKTIKTRSYDIKAKKWSFELKDYDELINKIQVFKFQKTGVQIQPLPKMVREIFKDKINSSAKQIESNEIIDCDHLRRHIDPTIFKSLLSFQQDSIIFAIKRNGRLLLADDMGLGKTIQSLGIASYYRNEWPLFITVPSSVKFMWKENSIRWISSSIREVAKLDDDEPVDDFIQVLENGRQLINPKAKIIISSYDLLSKNADEYSKVQYKVIIVDECHLLKNSKTQRAKSAMKLIQNAKRVILLSGTPALSRPAELFSQLNAINSTLFNNFTDFGMRYCDGKETHFGMDFSGYSNMVELKAILEESIMIRREKKDVVSQLPSKMREMVMLNPTLIELNTKALKEASNKMDCNLKGMEKRGALLSYFQETSKVKAKAVVEYVLDLLESGKKFLVFAHHQNMLNDVQQALEANKYDFIRIDGSTNPEKRQQNVHHFQNNEKCLCALLSITAASTGITLTQANLVIFAELYWNPGILVQAEDRVYRIGQQNSVLVQYLCAKGTADDEIWPLVNSKLNILSKAGLTKENLAEANLKEDKRKKLFEDLIEESTPKSPVKTPTESTKKFNDLLEGIDASVFDSPVIAPQVKKAKFN